MDTRLSLSQQIAAQNGIGVEGAQVMRGLIDTLDQMHGGRYVPPSGDPALARITGEIRRFQAAVRAERAEARRRRLPTAHRGLRPVERPRERRPSCRRVSRTKTGDSDDSSGGSEPHSEGVRR